MGQEFVTAAPPEKPARVLQGSARRGHFVIGTPTQDLGPEYLAEEMQQ